MKGKGAGWGGGWRGRLKKVWQLSSMTSEGVQGTSSALALGGARSSWDRVLWTTLLETVFLMVSWLLKQQCEYISAASIFPFLSY